MFPLVYILLSRHYRLLQAARSVVLDKRELQDAADSMAQVKDAIRYRVDDLAGEVRDAG